MAQRHSMLEPSRGRLRPLSSKNWRTSSGLACSKFDEEENENKKKNFDSDDVYSPGHAVIDGCASYRAVSSRQRCQARTSEG